MKNIVIILIFSFTLFSCSSDNEEPQLNIPTELIGKWKIYETFESDGDCIENCWFEYDSGKEYDIWFKSDGTYESGPNEVCNDCTFVVSMENEIFFYPNGSIDDPPVIKLLNSEFLTLWWKYMEGGGNKYKKIIE